MTGDTPSEKSVEANAETSGASPESAHPVGDTTASAGGPPIPARSGQVPEVDGADTEDSDRMARVGAIIRQSRDGRYSVKQLSKIAGVSAGLISQIERGVGNPSITTLTRLAYALGLSIGSFFEADPVLPHRDLQLVTADGRKRLIMPGHSLEYQLLSPNLQGSLGMVKTLIKPHFDNRSQPFIHPGEEIVYLARGSLGVRVGRQECLMNVGDTVTYDCGMPHAWFNPYDEPAEVIAAMSPPSF